MKNHPGARLRGGRCDSGDQPAMLPSPAFAAPDGTFETWAAGTVNRVL
jgi:hypothetical protein